MSNKKSQSKELCWDDAKRDSENQSIHSSTDLHVEHQKLRKAYQNLKQERDMLLKALNAYHKSLSVQHIEADKIL